VRSPSQLPNCLPQSLIGVISTIGGVVTPSAVTSNIFRISSSSWDYRFGALEGLLVPVLLRPAWAVRLLLSSGSRCRLRMSQQRSRDRGEGDDEDSTTQSVAHIGKGSQRYLADWWRRGRRERTTVPVLPETCKTTRACSNKEPSHVRQRMFAGHRDTKSPTATQDSGQARSAGSTWLNSVCKRHIARDTSQQRDHDVFQG
jgi:hypothetical protein